MTVFQLYHMQIICTSLQTDNQIAKEDIQSSLFVCLLANLHKNVQTDLHEILRESWQCADEQMIKFWWRSGSGIVTLARRALVEVCT